MDTELLEEVISTAKKWERSLDKEEDLDAPLDFSRSLALADRRRAIRESTASSSSTMCKKEFFNFTST